MFRDFKNTLVLLKVNEALVAATSEYQQNEEQDPHHTAADQSERMSHDVCLHNCLHSFSSAVLTHVKAVKSDTERVLTPGTTSDICTENIVKCTQEHVSPLLFPVESFSRTQPDDCQML